MTGLPPRLTQAQIRQAQRAGLLPKAGKSSFFGSMFSWFPSVTFGRLTFWPVQGESKPPVNAATAQSGQIVTPASALTISAVWACVWLIARTIATLPLNLKDVGGARKLRVDLELFEILRWQANDLMTAVDFWQFMIASLLLWGRGCARKIRRANGELIALDPLRPEWTTVYRKEGRIRFSYDDPNGKRDFSLDEVFYLKDRTLDGLSGLSVIEYGRNSMGLAQSGELAASKTFKSGLHASGFVKVDKFLTEPQRDQFRESIAEFTGDGPKAGGTMVLEGPVTDYKTLSMKPLDAELLASRQFSVEDVCRWFNTPPIMIGHASAGQTMWGSGVEQIFGGWTRLCIRPYLVVVQQAVRMSLLRPGERSTLYVEHDLDELLAADSAARAALYSQLVQNAIATRNECREKEGLPPMEGGDILTVQSNLIPLDQLGAAGAAGPADEVRNALLNLLQLTPAKEAKP